MRAPEAAISDVVHARGNTRLAEEKLVPSCKVGERWRFQGPWAAVLQRIRGTDARDLGAVGGSSEVSVRLGEWPVRSSKNGNVEQ